MLEPLWTMGDTLSTNLADIMEHQNADETDLNDNTGWSSDNYVKESHCDVDSDHKFDSQIHYWFKIVANAFQENTNFVYDFVLYIFFI